MSKLRSSNLGNNPETSAPPEPDRQELDLRELNKVYGQSSSAPETRYGLDGSLRSTGVTSRQTQNAIYGNTSGDMDDIQNTNTARFEEDTQQGEIVEIYEDEIPKILERGTDIETFSISDLYDLGVREKLAQYAEQLYIDRGGTRTTSLHLSNQRHGIHAPIGLVRMIEDLRNDVVTSYIRREPIPHARGMIGEKLIIEGGYSGIESLEVSPAWLRYAALHLNAYNPKTHEPLEKEYSHDIAEDILLYAGYFNIDPDRMFSYLVDYDDLESRSFELKHYTRYWLDMYRQRHPGIRDTQQRIVDAYSIVYELFDLYYGGGETPIYGTEGLIPFNERLEIEANYEIARILRISPKRDFRRCQVGIEHQPVISIATAGSSFLRKRIQTKGKFFSDDLENARELDSRERRFDYKGITGVSIKPRIYIFSTGKRLNDWVICMDPHRTSAVQLTELELLN